VEYAFCVCRAGILFAEFSHVDQAQYLFSGFGQVFGKLLNGFDFLFCLLPGLSQQKRAGLIKCRQLAVPRMLM
jgi:hypothetical protein